MGKHIVEGGQNIWDIAVQMYGTVEGVFQLLADNPDLKNLDATLLHGGVLNITEASEVEDVRVTQVNKLRGNQVRTGDEILIPIENQTPENVEVSFANLTSIQQSGLFFSFADQGANPVFGVGFYPLNASNIISFEYDTNSFELNGFHQLYKFLITPPVGWEIVAVLAQSGTTTFNSTAPVIFEFDMRNDSSDQFTVTFNEL